MERAGRLEGGWRLRHGGDAPATPAERVLAWMIARPGAAVALGLVAVAALTGLALIVGPPVGKQG